MDSARQMSQRNYLFLIFNIIIFTISYPSIKDLAISSFHNELYSHIIIIPVISGYFVYLRRQEIFLNSGYSFSTGAIIIMFGSMLYLIGMNQGNSLSQNDYLSLLTLSMVIIWIGGFVLFYGYEGFRAAAFPLIFLFFMIPLPDLIMERIISFLIWGSTEVTHVFFKLTGIPVWREGFVFHLPGLSIEVAEQCSGIRSSIALLITGILAGRIFINTASRKLILILSILPIAIFKNGIRIVTLSLLSIYVDGSFINGPLHKRGGVFFFLIAIALLGTALWFLRSSESGILPYKIKGTKKKGNILN